MKQQCKTFTPKDNPSLASQQTANAAAELTALTALTAHRNNLLSCWFLFEKLDWSIGIHNDDNHSNRCHPTDITSSVSSPWAH